MVPHEKTMHRLQTNLKKVDMILLLLLHSQHKAFNQGSKVIVSASRRTESNRIDDKYRSPKLGKMACVFSCTVC